jgi:hypothetical protein
MYPSAATPRAGTFIEQQVEGLRRLGHEVGVVVVDRAASGPLRYVAAGRQVQRAASSSTWDVAHVMYGGVLAFLASRALRDLPIIISFCGTDLLGTEPGSFQMGFRGALGVYCSRKASLDANAVIVKSKTMLSRLPAAVDSGRVSVIPNGVDLSRFKPKNRIDARQRLGWAKEEFTVLFSTHGPSDRNKRLPLAEAAVEAVRSEGIQAGIKILTGVPHHLVPLWINASDVTLMTSCHEGSPQHREGDSGVQSARCVGRRRRRGREDRRYRGLPPCSTGSATACRRPGGRCAWPEARFIQRGDEIAHPGGGRRAARFCLR